MTATSVENCLPPSESKPMPPAPWLRCKKCSRKFESGDWWSSDGLCIDCAGEE